jgi:hypothetical protein
MKLASAVTRLFDKHGSELGGGKPFFLGITLAVVTHFARIAARSGHQRLPTAAADDKYINRRIGALLPWREQAMRVLRASGGGKRREPLAWWVPAARLSSSRVDWLAQPMC